MPLTFAQQQALAAQEHQLAQQRQMHLQREQVELSCLSLSEAVLSVLVSSNTS